jgi:hypothetical protein
MRWPYFLVIVLLTAIAQTTVAQVMWFRTPLGWVGPELLAMVAVFAALYGRGGLEVAIAGWVCGMTVDLTLSGEGMGMLSLLYSAGAVGVYNLREGFFRERPLTHALMGGVFCLFVYQAWSGYEALVGGGRWGHMAIQALGLSVYTAVLTPGMCWLLRKLGRVLLPAGAAGHESR